MPRYLVVAGSLAFALFSFRLSPEKPSAEAWIRINLAGYKPGSVKIAVWAAKENASIEIFQLVDKQTGKVIFEGKAGPAYGTYGPFRQSYRLDFTSFERPARIICKLAPPFLLNSGSQMMYIKALPILR